MAQQHFSIFAETKGIMPLFNKEPHLVERIFEGDDQAFASMYEKYRDKFFGCFKKRCSEEQFGNRRLYRFNDWGSYLDDLYQNSCLKLYNQIMTGKMFVQKRIYFELLNILTGMIQIKIAMEEDGHMKNILDLLNHLLIMEKNG